jgi:hypothetical protein
VIQANQRDVWTDAHQVQFEAAERIIDRAIENSEGDTITVDVSAATTSERVLRRLETAYREGGWVFRVAKEEWRSSGVWVELKVAGAPRSGPGVG